MKGIRLFVALCALVFASGRCLAQEQNANYTVTDLGTLGGSFSDGWGLNDRGQVTHDQVVGTSVLASGQPHAFLWHDGVMTDLNALIPSNSGWVLTIARSINSSGEIVGSGTINGQTHAFLLTPDDDNE